LLYHLRYRISFLAWHRIVWCACTNISEERLVSFCGKTEMQAVLCCDKTWHSVCHGKTRRRNPESDGSRCSHTFLARLLHVTCWVRKGTNKNARTFECVGEDWGHPCCRPYGWLRQVGGRPSQQQTITAESEYATCRSDITFVPGGRRGHGPSLLQSNSPMKRMHL
jgi:hypothetical protein